MTQFEKKKEKKKNSLGIMLASEWEEKAVLPLLAARAFVWGLGTWVSFSSHLDLC